MELASENLTEKALRDYELVIRARDKGDEQAYAELLKQYRDPIYYMLLKMTNSPVDADDLTIEAFGKAFKALPQYTPNFAFSTWLFRIATNNCIDFIRKQRAVHVSMDNVYHNKDGDEYSVDLPSESLDPEEKIIQKQNRVMIRNIVSKLKPDYRSLIELRYFSELSYEEIASELDLPLGTVKARLFRAKVFLQNIAKNSNMEIL